MAQPPKAINNYRRGAQYERVFRAELQHGENHLYSVRSAGSHGVLDVLELQYVDGQIQVWGYQIKSGKNKPRIAAGDYSHLQFLAEKGVNVRIIWKQRAILRRFTLEEAAQFVYFSDSGL